MATHSSVLAWRIPGTGEPGGLPSMGSHRVGHALARDGVSREVPCSALKGETLGMGWIHFHVKFNTECKVSQGLTF